MSKKRKRNKNIQDDSKKNNNRNQKYIVVILLLLVIFSLLVIFDIKTFMGGDNAHYASLAKSLLNGHYRVVAFISHPPETGVPPGYPIILAVLFALFGLTFIPVKIFSLLCFVISLWIWWKIFLINKVNKIAAFALVAFAIFNTSISEFSHWELTEAVYMLVSSFAIYWFFISEKNEKFLNWIILGILGVASYYIRATGAMVSIAIFIALLLRKKWKSTIVFSVTNAILLAPWIIRNLLISGQVTGGGYTSQFFTNPATGVKYSAAQFLAKFGNNLTKYIFVHLPSLFFPLGQQTFYKNTGLGYFIGAILIMTIIIGIIFLLKKRREIFVIYIILYLILLSMFNKNAVLLRYIIVIYPFIAICVVGGLKFIEDRLKLKRWFSLLFTIGVATLALPVYINAVSQNFPILIKNVSGNRFAGYHPVYVRFIEANEWIMKNVPDEVGIISRKPRLTWLFSRHPAKNYLYLSPEDVMADIDTSGAQYVLIDRLSGTTQQFLIPTIQQYPDRFESVYVTGEPKTYVLKILPKSKPMAIPPDSVISEQ